MAGMFSVTDISRPPSAFPKFSVLDEIANCLFFPPSQRIASNSGVSDCSARTYFLLYL